MRPWVLETIADPNVSFLLAAIGVLGVYWELCAPGRVLPGATGGVLLLIGVFGLSQQAVSVSGLTLVVLGIALLLAAPFIGSLANGLRASQTATDCTGWAGVFACCLGLAWLISPPIRIHPVLAAGVGGPVAWVGGYLWMIAVRGTQLKSVQSLLR